MPTTAFDNFKSRAKELLKANKIEYWRMYSEKRKIVQRVKLWGCYDYEPVVEIFKKHFPNLKIIVTTGYTTSVIFYVKGIPSNNVDNIIHKTNF